MRYYLRGDLEADRARVAEITTCVGEIQARVSKMQAEIQVHVAKMQAEIQVHVAKTQAQICDLKRSITELRTEQAVAQQRIDSHKHYPVLTLPNEITSEIFIHSLPTYPAYPPLVGALSPTSLTQICHKWREVALATPALWRAIEFRRDSGRSEEYSFQIEKWLNRSHSCSLSIHIVGTAYDLYNALSTLVPHQARLEHLYLDINAQYSLLRPFPIPMPLLRRVDLSLSNCKSFELRAIDSPQLRSVRLFNNSVALAVPTLPWAQLTSLMLWEMVPNVMVPILHHVPNLIRCVLKFQWQQFRFSGPNITLPCLETLVLVGGDAVAKHITPNLSVPALLRLEFEQGTLGVNHIALLKALVLTTIQLREIEITGCTTRRNTVWPSENEYRTALPSVSRFSFQYRTKLYSEY
ncbi:F-box domain-containing protein [Mycena sanguinolenta]|uniref:F-box domain-containing protein n=1 Tax=Mycena sanguinolenta TaxID=230812 RepID=A0A8H7DB96_9AGAR|nr:F-box domain-containing protein [Mycena sanguinolenta]